MKRVVIFLFLLTVFGTNAQSIDYNTKKGVAIQGYDVVAYFNGTPQKGSAEFTYVYDKVTYKFSSEENLNLFTKSPKQYLPQYGGYCAYAIALKGKKVDVNPKTYEIRNGKLYLFYNSWGNNTLISWLEKQPEELVKKADENWKNLN